MRLYETMARHAPDVFIHSGDQIYADNPLRPEVTLDDGTVWRNVVTDAKRKVAETLDEFRGNFAYNLLDRHARAFNSQVPMIVQWDDHEVLNNWNPGTDLSARPQYTERSIAMLAARAKRAMFEYLPIRSHPDEAERVYRAYPYGPLAEVIVLDQRSYRAANGANRQAAEGPETRMMGPAQVAWFKQRLLASRATWKVIASDMPLGLLIGDGQRAGVPAYEAWANGPGGPLGRELELADVLSFIRDHAHPERRLGHRRRALRGGAPLRPGGRRVQASSCRSGSLSPVLSMPARSRRANPIRPSAARRFSTPCPPTSNPTGRPARATSSSGRSRSIPPRSG